jgi:uncharacterized membrane protein YhhN
VDRRGLYALGKTVASVAFVAIALSGGVPDAAWARTMLVALAISAVGDVILAGRDRVTFALGLLAFTVAHAAFAVAFTLRADALPASLGAAGLAALAAVPAWRALRSRWSVPRALRGPVAGYLGLVLAMAGLALVAAATRGSWPLAVGAVLVGGSDLAVARERFGRASFANKLLGLPAYYAGQVLLALQVASG